MRSQFFRHGASHALVLAAALAAATLARPAEAQISDAEGRALGSVEHGCTPCCFVHNLSFERTVLASIIAASGRASETIAPGERKALRVGGECVTAGYLLRVDFVRSRESHVGGRQFGITGKPCPDLPYGRLVPLCSLR